MIQRFWFARHLTFLEYEQKQNRTHTHFITQQYMMKENTSSINLLNTLCLYILASKRDAWRHLNIWFTIILFSTSFIYLQVCLFLKLHERTLRSDALLFYYSSWCPITHKTFIHSIRHDECNIISPPPPPPPPLPRTAVLRYWLEVRLGKVHCVRICWRMEVHYRTSLTLEKQ